MHQGLDLSKFRKISADKKMTTLRHTKGHEIKVAHSAMSPAMREQIEKLPVYMAEGGGVEAMDPDSPEEADDDEEDVPEAEDAPEEGAEEPEEAPDEAPAPVAAPEEQAAAAPEEPIPPKPQNMSSQGDANTITVTGQRRPPPPTPQELDNEDALFAQDVQRGHIKPETMADLFAKKDTLGKIGTIFGLIVGGAGAGLSGQPNALLGMMQNEIQKDYDAQVKSNDNAQNWLRLSQQHEMQKAQIGQIGADVAYKKALTGKVPAETEQIKAATAAHRADADLRASESAKIKMQIAALNHLQGEVDKMPPGPSKDAATQSLTQIGGAVQQNISATNAKTATILGVRAAARGEELPQPAIDWKKLQLLQAAGQASATSGITAMPGQSLNPQQAAAAQQEAGKIQANRSLYGNWKNAVETLDSRNAAGRLNEESYKAITSPIVAQMTQGMPSAEAESLGQSIFPSWKDWGKARGDKVRFGYDHFKTMEADTPITTQFGLKMPFPGPPQLNKKSAEGGAAPAKQKQALRDGMTAKDSHGHGIIVKGGKWVYQ